MTKNNISALCYISEQTSYPEDQRSFGYKVHGNPDGNRFYLTFPAVLQSFGVQNRNRRYYEAQNVMDRINNDEGIQDQLRRNVWAGEMDHPTSWIAGQELSAQRIGQPDPRHTCHYIRTPHLEDNLLCANIQTDSSTKEGMSLAIKILEGKVIPAFSARVLGELVNKNGRPTVNVKRYITADYVSYPSHKEAIGSIRHEQVIESVNVLGNNYTGIILPIKNLAKQAANNSKETQWICESFGLDIDDVIGLTEDSDIIIKENSNVYIQPICDKFVRNKTKNMLRDFIN